jgi:hypothetical protein
MCERARRGRPSSRLSDADARVCQARVKLETCRPGRPHVRDQAGGAIETIGSLEGLGTEPQKPHEAGRGLPNRCNVIDTRDGKLFRHTALLD